jgi:hypothetical protein
VEYKEFDTRPSFLYCLLQNFILTWHKDIRQKGHTMCWDVSDIQNKATVNLFPCHGMQGNQLWRYNLVSWIQQYQDSHLKLCAPASDIISALKLTSSHSLTLFSHIL